MATLAEATKPMSRRMRKMLRPVGQFESPSEKPFTAGAGSDVPSDNGSGQPVRSIRLKCPLPLIQSQPDSLRQYYGDELPQTRLVVPLGLL